jgi:hypothetical protein
MTEIKQLNWRFIMKLYTYGLTTTLILLLFSSCRGDAATAPAEPTQPSPGDEQAYPGPDQGGSEGDQVETPMAEPYPEPGEVIPAEPGIVDFPSDHAYAPASEDEQMVRGNVFIDESELILLESYPVQAKLDLDGSLPTPCHELRAVAQPPDDQDEIHVEVYSLTDPDQICIQVLEAFTASIPLGSYTEGKYTVWVNDEVVGEINLP